jgi:hypothetical protein
LLGWNLGTESKEELAQRATRADLAEKSNTWNWIDCPNIEKY